MARKHKERCIPSTVPISRKEVAHNLKRNEQLFPTTRRRNGRYRAMVDKEPPAIARHEIPGGPHMYHEKIDHLLNAYAPQSWPRKHEQGFAIDTRVTL